MQVTLTLSGPLRSYYKTTASTKGEEFQLEPGSTMNDVLARYGIRPEKAHMIVINRRKAKVCTALNDGDHIRILPLAAGG